MPGVQSSIDAATAIAGAVAAVVGAAIWLGLVWALPRVEVLPVSRLQQLLGVLYKGGIAAVLSALIGGGVKAVLGG